VACAPSTQAAENLVAYDASRGFELLHADCKSVLRCVLVRVTHSMHDDAHLLFLNVHHVAFDGASTSVLFGELGSLYPRGQVTRETSCSDLAALPIQYVDYALWQRGDALAPSLGVHREYWRSALREGELPVLELPLDFPRPAIQSFAGDSVRFSLPASVTARLEAQGRSHSGCTLFQTVVAVWALLLCRHTGQDDVVIGTPYHGRDAAGTEGLIGYFVNMLALLVGTGQAGGSTVSTLLQRVHAVSTDSMSHALLPFQAIVHDLLPRRSHDASRNAIFQSMLAWGEEADVRTPANSDYCADSSSGTCHTQQASKVDLSLHAAHNTTGHIHGGLEFQADLFSHLNASHLAHRLMPVALAFCGSL
jgi:hypothetical protein